MPHATFFSWDMSPTFCTAATPCWASCFASTSSWAHILSYVYTCDIILRNIRPLCLLVPWEFVCKILQWQSTWSTWWNRNMSLSQSPKVSSNVHGTPGSTPKCEVSFLRSSASVHIFFLGKQGRRTCLPDPTSTYPGSSEALSVAVESASAGNWRCSQSRSTWPCDHMQPPNNKWQQFCVIFESISTTPQALQVWRHLPNLDTSGFSSPTFSRRGEVLSHHWPSQC